MLVLSEQVNFNSCQVTSSQGHMAGSVMQFSNGICSPVLFCGYIQCYVPQQFWII